MNAHSCGLLFVFSGPSGAGKNTVMKAVMERSPALKQLATATTRPIRDDELHGREHEFISEEEFRRRILQKELIEWQIIHDKGIYGVPRKTIQEGIRSGKTMVADVDVLGAMQLKEEFGDYMVLIFVNAPDKMTLERRLRSRADFSDEDELRARLRRADFEIEFAELYDYQVINRDGELEASVQETLNIVDESCRNAPPTDRDIGWDPHNIEQRVTGLLVQNGKILLHHQAFPVWRVPDNDQMLPFDVLQTEFETQLNIDVLPTRHDAIHRKVDISFEPAQMVQSSNEGDHYEKHFIYVLQTTQPILDLPPFWSWMPIENLHLEPALKNILEEANLLQPVD